MPKLKGIDVHLKRLRNLAGPKAAEYISKALFAGGESIQVEAQRLISAGSVSGKGHVPSKPGEPPNYDSGILAGKIETVQKTPFLVEVSSNAPYAAALEYGTSKMEERPYMRPARDAKKAEVIANVKRAANAAVKGSKT